MAEKKPFDLKNISKEKFGDDLRYKIQSAGPKQSRYRPFVQIDGLSVAMNLKVIWRFPKVSGSS